MPRKIISIAALSAVFAFCGNAASFRWDINLNFHPGWNFQDSSAAARLAVQADDKIVVVGYFNRHGTVIRVMKDGAFDTTFQTDVTAHLWGVSIGAMGDIFISGRNQIFRLSRTGRLLQTYEGFPDYPLETQYYSMALQPDG